MGPCATIPQSPPSAPSAMCAPVAPAEGAICIRPHAHATQVLKQVSISAPMRCSPDSFGFSYSVRGGPAGEQRPVRNLFELAAEEPPMASVVLGARDALVLRSMLCCRRCRRHHHHGRSVWQDHRRWLLLVGGQPRFNESRSPATHWSFFVIDGRTTSILHRLAAGHHQRVLQLCCWRVCCCGSGPAALNSWMCTLI